MNKHCIPLTLFSQPRPVKQLKLFQKSQTKMEDIRKSVTMLQEKIKKLAIADEAFKEVINCNSKNLEALKNYTLELNERMVVIEDGIKNNTNATGDLAIEK